MLCQAYFAECTFSQHFANSVEISFGLWSCPCFLKALLDHLDYVLACNLARDAWGVSSAADDFWLLFWTAASEVLRDQGVEFRVDIQISLYFFFWFLSYRKGFCMF